MGRREGVRYPVESVEWVVPWLLLFRPAAIAYHLTRNPYNCPARGGNVYINPRGAM